MISLEAISLEAQEFFKKRVSLYGAEHKIYSPDDIDLNRTLNAWQIEKEELFNIFGKKLQLEKKIYFAMPDKEFYRIVGRRLFNLPFHISCRGILDTDIFFAVFGNAEDWGNNLSSHNIDFNLNGKFYHFPIGTKMTKIASRIATAIDKKDEYEEFRLEHSRIMAERCQKGVLVASINPCDFSTMSDNEYNWSSCMSWEDSGCYRSGTIEMMNSKNVIVVYLKNPTNNSFLSKKWRTLVVADSDMVMNIKGYPYQSDELSKASVEFVKEIFENYYGGSVYEEVEKFDYDHHYFIDLHTYGVMYNDFNADHWTSRYFTINKIKRAVEHFYLEKNYCGPNTCVICGYEHNPSHSADLCCDECDEHLYCYDCDERIHADDCYEGYNGNIYCYDCYHDHYGNDVFGEEYPIEELTTINIFHHDYENSKNYLAYLSLNVSNDFCERFGLEDYIYCREGHPGSLYIDIADIFIYLQYCLPKTWVKNIRDTFERQMRFFNPVFDEILGRLVKIKN